MKLAPGVVFTNIPNLSPILDINFNHHFLTILLINNQIQLVI